MMKKLLITGGTGFLGCHVARLALKQGYDVTLYDIAPLTAEDLKDKVTVVQADVRDQESITKALKGIDYVVHAAAALPIQRTKEKIFSTNIYGTEKVLLAAKKQKIKRLVYISSTAVYGVPKVWPETEEAPLDPIGYYGESKIAGENLCRAYEKEGLQCNIIRPKTFLGVERLGVFQIWFDAIYTGKPVVILGDGNNKYQLLWVGDIADAILKALTAKVHGETFNIGAKNFGTWNEDLGATIKFAKSKSRILGLPVKPSQIILALFDKLNLSPIAEWHYRTLPVDSYVSTEKAEKLLGWKAQKSDKDLLIESYDWYAKHREEIKNRKGMTHRVGWNFGILDVIERLLP